ncbi:reverse transcriptase [Cucumis melo var. makuwa]|uniref:Reverse transcriptase n=1 Tax=Cucumis melo var. makuwa TaxID=1194695 RepID=A0A5A7TQ74_CUCMM|nr:reverse transcriptase [Cucumis melo var. makuwa]
MPLPNHLKYAYFRENDTLPVIISTHLDAAEENTLLNSDWVSLVQCVPKKGKMTVVNNEKNELIPMRTIIRWRICMDYSKLNATTKKDNFPLLFIDQMLISLLERKFIAFWMITLGTFQRCMMAIFSDFLERSVKIYMENFSVFEDSFKKCMGNLEEVLEKCEETQLVLNWKKCHFMVK